MQLLAGEDPDEMAFEFFSEGLRHPGTVAPLAVAVDFIQPSADSAELKVQLASDVIRRVKIEGLAYLGGLV